MWHMCGDHIFPSYLEAKRRREDPCLRILEGKTYRTAHKSSLISLSAYNYEDKITTNQAGNKDTFMKIVWE